MSLRTALLLALATLLPACGDAAAHHRSAHASDPVERLVQGNRRFVEARMRHPDATPARRAEVAPKQHPFAVVLSCADSRVPPEIVFDAGLGDLFTVRVAGNVVDDDVLGSIEYAVEHLHAGVIVVLGHERCGAVGAALEGKPLPGHVASLGRALAPAVKATEGMPGDRLDLTVRANVARVVEQIRSSGPILAEHVEKHGVRVLGARYDLDTGVVEFLTR